MRIEQNVGHVYLFRRHGLKAKEPIKKKDGMFWPDQIWREVVACGAVLLTVLVNGDTQVESDETLTAVAHESGFSNADHLYKVFIRVEGMSPTDYRQERFE